MTFNDSCFNVITILWKAIHVVTFYMPFIMFFERIFCEIQGGLCIWMHFVFFLWLVPSYGLIFWKIQKKLLKNEISKQNVLKRFVWSRFLGHIIGYTRETGPWPGFWQNFDYLSSKYVPEPFYKPIQTWFTYFSLHLTSTVNIHSFILKHVT